MIAPILEAIAEEQGDTGPASSMATWPKPGST
jgi:hypothetical protein